MNKEASSKHPLSLTRLQSAPQDTYAEVHGSVSALERGSIANTTMRMHCGRKDPSWEAKHIVCNSNVTSWHSLAELNPKKQTRVSG